MKSLLIGSLFLMCVFCAESGEVMAKDKKKSDDHDDGLSNAQMKQVAQIVAAVNKKGNDSGDADLKPLVKYLRRAKDERKERELAEDFQSFLNKAKPAASACGCVNSGCYYQRPTCAPVTCPSTPCPLIR